MPAGDARKTALPIGQEIEPRVDDLLEEFWAVATAIEDNRNAALAQQFAHLLQDRRQHLDHTRIGLGGKHEQGIPGLIVDPVVGGGRHGETHLGDMRFGQAVLSVVNPDVAVDVKEAQVLSPSATNGRAKSQAKRSAFPSAMSN